MGIEEWKGAAVLKTIDKDLILFVSLLLAWTWGGGYILKDHAAGSLGFFFLFSTLVLPLLFMRVRGVTLRDLGITRDLGNKRLYGKVLLVYLVIFASLVLVTMSVSADVSVDGLLLAQAVVILPLILVITIVQAFMEELTWAGWLYDKVYASYMVKVFIIAMIWFVWHIPFYLWTDQLIELVPLRLEVLLLLVIYFFALRYVYSWFREHSGNPLWATVAHGVANGSGFIAIIALDDPVFVDGVMLFAVIAVFNLVLAYVLHQRFPPIP